MNYDSKIIIIPIVFLLIMTTFLAIFFDNKAEKYRDLSERLCFQNNNLVETINLESNLINKHSESNLPMITPMNCKTLLK